MGKEGSFLDMFDDRCWPVVSLREVGGANHNWRAQQAGRNQRAIETLMELEAIIPCGWVRTEELALWNWTGRGRAVRKVEGNSGPRK